MSRCWRLRAKDAFCCYEAEPLPPPHDVQIDVVMFGREAERFFSDLPPFNPSTGTRSAEALARWLTWLMAAPPEPMVPTAIPSTKGTAAAAASGGPGGTTSSVDLTGSGMGFQWLDVCVSVGFLDQRQAEGRPVGSWIMPMIRIVDTVGVAPRS